MHHKKFLIFDDYVKGIGQPNKWIIFLKCFAVEKYYRISEHDLHVKEQEVIIKFNQNDDNKGNKE